MDVGQVVHRSNVEGQMQGGVLQGAGWALNEEYFYNEDATMVNSSLLDYRMPTTIDLPMIRQSASHSAIAGSVSSLGSRSDSALRSRQTRLSLSSLRQR